jgi:CBS domain-containing protein
MYQPLSAGDLCTRNVVFAHRDMALGEAAQRMREHHVGCLVVVDDVPDGRQPVGLLTDRDIVIAVLARDVDVRSLRVDDVMSASPVTAREGDSLLDSLAAMRRAGVRRLPVIDAQGHLQGLLTLDDVVEVIGEQMSVLAQVLVSARRREPLHRP